MSEFIIDQGAFDEAQDIVRNTNNPRHQAYQRNDTTVVDYVTELLRRADPRVGDLADTTPPALKAGDPGDQAGTSPSEVETILRSELGSNFDPVINDAVQGLSEFFSNAADFEAAVNRLNLSPAQQVQGIKWLAERGGRGR